MKNKVRPIAICVFRHKDRILVAEGYDPVKKQTFYRPLGGGIEFGEKSDHTVRRELLEEINAEVGELWYLGALENIFVFNGAPGHEIVLVYDGLLKDSGLYDLELIKGEETEIGESFQAVWKSLDEFGAEKSILYPPGLLEMLKSIKT